MKKTDDKVTHPLLTTKYTEVWHENSREMHYGAPHHFHVRQKNSSYVAGDVNFQKGPLRAEGVNGVTNEEVLIMVLTRLEHFQKTEFACKGNEMAITKIEEALLWLNSRTMDREQRGVEGTHIV